MTNILFSTFLPPLLPSHTTTQPIQSATSPPSLTTVPLPFSSHSPNFPSPHSKPATEHYPQDFKNMLPSLKHTANPNYYLTTILSNNPQPFYLLFFCNHVFEFSTILLVTHYFKYLHFHMLAITLMETTIPDKILVLPTLTVSLARFRLCWSSKDNIIGYFLSLVYTLVVWWAQTYEDIAYFRPSQKQMSRLRKNQDTVDNSL